MPADELAALHRTAAVVADLDPATAWDLDEQLAGLAKVAVTLAEGLSSWATRLTGIGLHESITGAAENGSNQLAEAAAEFVAARRNLRTVYADHFAAAASGTSAIKKPGFWGEAAAGDAQPGQSPASGDAHEVNTGGWYDRTSGEAPYLDWSCRATGGGRELELGDGTDAVRTALDHEALSGLVDELGQMLDDPARASGGLLVSEDGSIDLTRNDDGTITLEISEGDETVAVDIPEDQVRAIHAQLTEDLHDVQGEDDRAAKALGGGYEVSTGSWSSDDGSTDVPYLDWSCHPHHTDGRQVELGDGTDAVNVDLTPDDAAGLVDELGAVLDDPARTSGGLSLADDGTIDITRNDDGTLTLEISDGDDAVAVTMPADQLRAIHEQLAQDVADDTTRALDAGEGAMRLARADDRDQVEALAGRLHDEDLRRAAYVLGAEPGADQTDEQVRAGLVEFMGGQLAACQTPEQREQEYRHRVKVLTDNARRPVDEPAPPAVPAPAAPAGPAPPARSDEPIRAPNNGADQGLMHFDSALGVLWNQLGDDRHLQVEGRALGNLVADLGEGISLRHHDTNQALRDLRRLRTQLPDGSRAARHVDTAIERLDAPDRPAPPLPDNAPQQLKTLMEDLNNINLVRRGYDYGGRDPVHETDRLAEATARWMAGELSPLQFERAVRDLTGLRHESSEGWTEIRDAVTRALRDFRQWSRPPTRQEADHG